MKYKSVAIGAMVLGLLPIIVTAAIYSFNFSELSGRGTDWASFGSYFGGINGPLLSFLGYIALVATVAIQGESYREVSHRYMLDSKERELQGTLLLVALLASEFDKKLSCQSPTHASCKLLEHFDRFCTVLDVPSPGSCPESSVFSELSDSLKSYLFACEMLCQSSHYKGVGMFYIMRFDKVKKRLLESGYM